MKIRLLSDLKGTRYLVRDAELAGERWPTVVLLDERAFYKHVERHEAGEVIRDYVEVSVDRVVS